MAMDFSWWLSSLAVETALRQSPMSLLGLYLLVRRRRVRGATWRARRTHNLTSQFIHGMAYEVEKVD